MKLKKGKLAPEFEAPNQDGKIIQLRDFAGLKLVLYFYPQDDTPTCTNQACNLRDNYNVLLKQGYRVLGVSPDTEKKHQKFIVKYKLPFDLLADPDLHIIKAYGVWGKKELFGRKYMGVKRTTFVIDDSGMIDEIIEKVISKDHSTQIMG